MDYVDDVPDEAWMRWASSFGGAVGGANGPNGDHQTLPIGLHHSPADRQAQRVARSGIVVVRAISNRK